MSDRVEAGREPAAALALLALLVVGLGLRLGFAAAFPVVPFSDFRALLDFGISLAQGGPTAGSWHWVQFNPGLPIILALLFRVVPAGEASARLATAFATGLLPLAPFYLWRGVLSLRGRFLAGLLLALWPGQVFFSGVLAQENWVLLPAVVLASLAVRVVRLPAASARPVLAGLLLAAAAAIRQEMLIVLAPAALAAAGVLRRDGRGLSRAAGLVLAAGLALAALAFQRLAATGRFAVTTEHSGLALLGSVVPGAVAAGWVDPRAHIASVEPELLLDRSAARAASARLALAEWKRRPAFHAFRSVEAALRLGVGSDAENLFWSIGSPSALPPEKRERGQSWFVRWYPALRVELSLIQGFFLVAAALALMRRDAASLVLVCCVVLKYGLQAVASPLSRLVVPATALELLAIGLAAGLVPASRSARVRLLAPAAAAALLLLILEPRVEAAAVARDDPPRSVRRFPLEIAAPGVGASHVRCAVLSGRVTFLEWKRAWLEPAGAGETARVECELPGAGERIGLRLEARGAQPEARVSVDGGPDTRLSGADMDLGSARRVAVELSAPGALSFVPSASR